MGVDDTMIMHMANGTTDYKCNNIKIITFFISFEIPKILFFCNYKKIMSIILNTYVCTDSKWAISVNYDK